MSNIEQYAPAAAILLLAGFVARWHKPWLATVALAALLAYRDFGTGRSSVHLLLHLLIYLCVGGALFWAIDRSTHLVLTLALVASGVLVLFLL